MLWSIDSCQIRVYADQNKMTVAMAQVPAHRGHNFFRFFADQLLAFNWSQARDFMFFQLVLGPSLKLSTDL